MHPKIAAHHAAALKIVQQVETHLVQLETGQDTSIGLQTDISQHLNTLAREVQALEELLPSVPVAERSLLRKKIAHLQDRSQSQRAALGKFAGRAAARQREVDERDALLTRRNGGGEHAINIEAFAKHTQQLNDVSGQVDDHLNSAYASLHALQSQRDALKGVQKKVRDVAATLGLSNSVLRAIESRQFWDQVLLLGGMVLTLALLWFCYRYMRA